MPQISATVNISASKLNSYLIKKRLFMFLGKDYRRQLALSNKDMEAKKYIYISITAEAIASNR